MLKKPLHLYHTKGCFLREAHVHYLKTKPPSPEENRREIIPTAAFRDSKPIKKGRVTPILKKNCSISAGIANLEVHFSRLYLLHLLLLQDEQGLRQHNCADKDH